MRTRRPFPIRAGYLIASAAILLATAALPLPAGPALTATFELSQPDGSTFPARLGGDEHFNWVSHQGSIILQDDNDWWYYASAHKGRLQATSRLAGLQPAPTGAARETDIAGTWRAAARQHAFAPQPVPALRRAPRHVVVILVEFTDRSLTSTTAYWSNLFFGTDGNTVRNYYEEVSGGSLTLTPAATGGAEPPGIVRVQLDRVHPHPDTVIGDTNRWIVYDALLAADPDIDWAALDADEDGHLSPGECHIVTVIAGYERGYAAGWTPAVYAHRWALGFQSDPLLPDQGDLVPAPTGDGVVLGDYVVGGGYAQLGELHGVHAATIGVPCHELGHDMGLSDLYDLTVTSSGIGGHGVMGYGNWGQAQGDADFGTTPTHPCAWSKARLGFVTPMLASGNQDYTLKAAATTAYSVVRVDTPDPDEYFLIENRQLLGFDAGLYRWFSASSGGAGGGGLAVWHVDESMSHNSDAAHKMVDLEEANEGPLGFSELDTLTNQGNREHYYYAEYIDAFGDAGTPGSRTYGSGVTYINMSSVSPSGPTMKCYISTQPITRDLEWSTYLGGWQRESANAVAVDESNNIVVVGGTNSSDFPTTPGVYDETMHGFGGMFVTRMSSGGSLLISTVFDSPGSSYAPSAYEVAVDDAGAVYITGQAYENLPTTPGAYDTSYNGGFTGSTWGDAFASKFDAALATLVYSTYLGGADYEAGFGIALDAQGNAYLAGPTNSSNFPHGDGVHGGNGSDVFATKLNATGTGYAYSRLFGAQFSAARALAADAGGTAYLSGVTYSQTFPTTAGAYDTSYNSPGYGDAFVTRLGLSGTIDYSTFLGGVHQDEAQGLTIDAAGNVYVTGFSSSSDFPTTSGAFHEDPIGRGDVFVTRLQPTSGSGLSYSTYLGAGEVDYAFGVDVDAAGNAFVAGTQDIDGMPSRDVYIAALNDDASNSLMEYYFAGSLRDEGNDCAIDSFGAVYVVGMTESDDFVTTPGAHDTTLGGEADAYVFKYGWAQLTDSVVLAVPDGGEAWCTNAQASITWTSSGAGGTVDIELSRGGPDGPWETLFASTPNDGQQDWTVAGPASPDCYVRVQDLAAAALTDLSNDAFEILDCGCTTVADCADGDGDGIRDDACTWWECQGGVCVGTTRGAGQADLGGFSGACPIDGACDINDKFHAQNCFGNQDTQSNPGYPCEGSVPTPVYNVDAGGFAGSCVLDGTCDINDVFAAQNCFANLDTDGLPPYPCACSPAPRPAGPARRPEPLAQATLSLLAPRVVRAGERVEVEMYLDASLDRLRGYQLHVGVSGGTRGRLEIVDFHVDERRQDYVYGTAGTRPWAVFNAPTGQMMNGLDAAITSIPAQAYLGTVTLQVSSDAGGVFVVDLLHDEVNPVPRFRTFLFATPYQPIGIDAVEPAAIVIRPQRRDLRSGRAD